MTMHDFGRSCSRALKNSRKSYLRDEVLTEAPRLTSFRQRSRRVCVKLPRLLSSVVDLQILLRLQTWTRKLCVIT